LKIRAARRGITATKNPPADAGGVRRLVSYLKLILSARSALMLAPTLLAALLATALLTALAAGLLILLAGLVLLAALLAALLTTLLAALVGVLISHRYIPPGAGSSRISQQTSRTVGSGLRARRKVPPPRCRRYLPTSTMEIAGM
jgi:hypothetical protein